MSDRYALLTVDTEALPNRAETDHVRRLILGKHGDREAGVKEMALIGEEYGARLIFFLDLCGAYPYLDELREIAAWLVARGQDVELHAHPEYLPLSFWEERGLNQRPWYMNEYPDDRAQFIIGYFTKLLTEFTGKKPVAFRAGSFRWNSAILKALASNGYKLSFNNSMCAVANAQCPFSLPTNQPFRWSNGLIEIPVSERHIFPLLQKNWWARLQYPQSKYYRFRASGFSFIPGSVDFEEKFLVFLLHSWSFLYRDENGYEIYKEDKWLERYRAFLQLLSRECDIINCAEALDLIERGKIKLAPPVNIALANRPARKPAAARDN